jgi:hypothetical protein
MNRPSDHHNHLVQIFSTIDSRSRSQHQHPDEQMMLVQMATTNAATTALAHEPSVIDYGYEDHKPSPKRHYDSKKIVSSSDLLLASPCLLEVTDSTASCGATDDSCSYRELNECDFPPIPADRQALKQRSFCRRGGEGHSSLLRAAVMASMDSQEEQGDSGDDAATGGCHHRRSGRNSDISLISLQEALSETTGPRKRARHADTSISRSFSSIEFESGEDQMETPEETTGEDDDQDDEEDDVLQFSGDEEDDDEEEDEQVAQVADSLNTLVMNQSFTKLSKNHRRSYSGNLRLTTSLLSSNTSATLLNSSISSLPNVRSYSTGNLCPPSRGPRRWVSRRTSYDSWASAASDHYSADS